MSAFLLFFHSIDGSGLGEISADRTHKSIWKRPQKRRHFPLSIKFMVPENAQTTKPPVAEQCEDLHEHHTWN